MNDERLRQIIKEKVRQTLCVENIAPASAAGIFSHVGDAIEMVYTAQRKYLREPLETRRRIVAAIRAEMYPLVPEMSRLAVEESGMGRVEHRILKNRLALDKTPGCEDLQCAAWSGDDGLSVVELSPFGVIGAITPVTNPTETILNNAIGMLAAGNAVVFSPHPAAVKVSSWLVEQLNQSIIKASGIANLVATMDQIKPDTVAQMMQHPKINLLVATGGPEIVKTVLSSGKKAIGAGAGNPPVIVDETADIEKAAADIVAGCSFDNNLPCIAEKEVFVCEQVADFLLFCMQKHNAIQIEDRESIEKIRRTIMRDSTVIHKKFVGKDASYILNQCGIAYHGKPELIFMEVPNEHPFVQTELMMPVLAIVRCKDFNEALGRAVSAEAGLRHTAQMHSKNVDRLTEAARLLQTTIFVKNGPSYNGIGYGGEGYTCFTIAGPTGEGLTSAKDFCRKRRCVLAGGFYIR